MNKTEDIRLLDIFILGPFMVWLALQKTQPEWARPWALLSGIGTIIYNFETYRAGK